MTEKEKTKSALLDPKRGTLFSEMLAYWCCVIGDLSMQINSMIRNDESFQKAYDSFLRDWKISNIIG